MFVDSTPKYESMIRYFDEENSPAQVAIYRLLLLLYMLNVYDILAYKRIVNSTGYITRHKPARKRWV